MSTPSPDISFVVIGFNEAAHLGACLRSVQAADLAGLVWELLFVDGGSTDDSREIAAATGQVRILGGDESGAQAK